jgi:hypothetical protein
MVYADRRMNQPVPMMIFVMVGIGALAVSEGNKHSSAAIAALGWLSIFGGAYFSIQWFRARRRDAKAEDRKKK